MEEKVIKDLRVGVLTLFDNGIVCVRFKEGAEMEIEDAREIISEMKLIHSGDKVCLLNDIRKIKSVSKEARDFAASREVASVTKAQAGLVSSHISRIIGNFFTGLNKPSFPVVLFDDEEKALSWLSEEIIK